MRVAIALAVLASVVACAAAPQRKGTMPIRLTSVRIARVSSPGLMNAQVPVDTETDFLTTDPFVWFLLVYNGGHQGDKIRVEWRNPLGTVVEQNDHTQAADGIMRLAYRMLIAGAPASYAPGDWQVRLFWNDQGVAVTPFRIAAPPETVVKIASRVVLPNGTVGVPYFLQLMATGGSPPYQWTAVKPFPAGMELSAAGTITGAPERRGGYRATVEAKDSAGNTVARSVGIGIGVAATGAHAGTPMLLKSAVPGACPQSGGQTDFQNADASVSLAVNLEAPAAGEGRLEWLNPRGEVALMSRVHKSTDGVECMVEEMPIAGHRLPGDWRVRLLWRDAEVFTTKFRIAGAPTTTTAAAARGGRTAVVIGNLQYEKLPARGPVSADMDAIAAALHEDGFQVVRKANVTLDGLRMMERSLGDTLHAGDTVFVYYAGYGARSGGDDWLLPVNYDPADAKPIQSKAYSVVRFRQVLEDNKVNLKLIVLDTAAAGQVRESGDSPTDEADDSTLLVYARSPDGAPGAAEPPAGAFSKALVEVLRRPGVNARDAMQVELPKALARLAPGSPPPVAMLGGGADFVFRVAAPAGRKGR